jgi:3-hydroxymyristoyl/3-hydroxydecanoyl-(acyl carrier protein) dehydratase
MRHQALHVIPRGHPCLDGHFPGNPIVPAVMILNCVEDTLAAGTDGKTIGQIVRAKFVSVLRPDECFSVELTSNDGSVFRFDCRKDQGTPVALGEIVAAAVPP